MRVGVQAGLFGNNVSSTFRHAPTLRITYHASPLPKISTECIMFIYVVFPPH
jgi:hypothetical protein